MYDAARADLSDAAEGVEYVPTLLAAAECLRDAGFRAFEITLTTPGANAPHSQLRDRLGPHGMVGAGTVPDADSARRHLEIAGN